MAFLRLIFFLTGVVFSACGGENCLRFGAVAPWLRFIYLRHHACSVDIHSILIAGCWQYFGKLYTRNTCFSWAFSALEVYTYWKRPWLFSIGFSDHIHLVYVRFTIICLSATSKNSCPRIALTTDKQTERELVYTIDKSSRWKPRMSPRDLA